MIRSFLGSPGPGWRFARFFVTGLFNAATCVLFSWLATFVIPSPFWSFVVGYALSLVLSYFVNAVFVFAEQRFSFAQFGRFCLSYVPNFVIQILTVYVLINVLEVLPVLAYALSVAIAVPLTFLLLSVYAFRPRHG